MISLAYSCARQQHTHIQSTQHSCRVGKCTSYRSACSKGTTPRQCTANRPYHLGKRLRPNVLILASNYHAVNRNSGESDIDGCGGPRPRLLLLGVDKFLLLSDPQRIRGSTSTRRVGSRGSRRVSRRHFMASWMDCNTTSPIQMGPQGRQLGGILAVHWQTSHLPEAL